MPADIITKRIAAAWEVASTTLLKRHWVKQKRVIKDYVSGKGRISISCGLAN